ncbi:MAG: cytochrome d ubiquinol oxidase subunit II [Planctomycetia bacterium]|nr:cytochrome d ubiquinol oxidase subunit II [Planctomycetia bacterium]
MSPEDVVLAILTASLVLYAVFGGADFGAGIWEFATALPGRERERRMLHRAIQPVWEANHVWLIFALVLLLTAFPAAFAAVCRALWAPLLLGLTGIVFRGAGFVLRPTTPSQRDSTDRPKGAHEPSAWEKLFALGSTAAPFFLGASVGAVASGKLPCGQDGQFYGNFVTGWITPLSFFTGVFTLSACAFVSAVFLTREAAMKTAAAEKHGDAPVDLRGDPLVRVWRRRALLTGHWAGSLAVAGLVLVAAESPPLWRGLLSRSWPLVLLSAGSAWLSLWATWKRRFTLASFGAIVAVGAIVCGWVAGQYPALVPPAITVVSAKAPDSVLWLVVWIAGAGATVLAPSLALLLWLFKAERRD